MKDTHQNLENRENRIKFVSLYGIHDVYSTNLPVVAIVKESKSRHGECFLGGMTSNVAKYRTWANPTPVTGIWTKIVVLFGNFIKNQIPEGYQDKDGFHFGVKRPQRDTI